MTLTGQLLAHFALRTLNEAQGVRDIIKPSKGDVVDNTARRNDGSGGAHLFRVYILR